MCGFLPEGDFEYKENRKDVLIFGTCEDNIHWTADKVTADI